MYICTCCGEKFDEENAGVKHLSILIHGEEEIDTIDCCPYCRSDELADAEDDEEADNE